MLVELPPVAPEQTLMLFTLTYSNGYARDRAVYLYVSRACSVG